MLLLLDTNVVSEMRKPPAKRSDEFNQWAQGFIEPEAYLSVVTITEIEKGILLLDKKDQQHAAVLRRWFIERVLTIYKKANPSGESYLRSPCSGLGLDPAHKYARCLLSCYSNGAQTCFSYLQYQ